MLYISVNSLVNSKTQIIGAPDSQKKYFAPEGEKNPKCEKKIQIHINFRFS